MAVVLKFGGTSVGTFDAVSRTMEIIASRLPEHPVVCVSALSKVTDLLYAIADAASCGDTEGLEARAAFKTSETRVLAVFCRSGGL